MLTKTSSSIVTGLSGAAVVLDMTIGAGVASVGAVTHQTSLSVGALATIATRRLFTARGQTGAGGAGVLGGADALGGQAIGVAGGGQGVAYATIVTRRGSRTQVGRRVDITESGPVVA